MIEKLQKFSMNRKMCRLVAFQRNELLSDIEKKLRKIFGRLFFTKILSYFVNKKNIENKYWEVMQKEYFTLNKYIPKDCKNMLCIGAGLGGLEALINKDFSEINFCLIEKNYVSKKIVYGWDINNKEAYNDLGLTRSFMERNGVHSNKIKLFDFDKDSLPEMKFDIIISLYSLEYHYQLEIYLKYFKRIAKENTVFIFDTVNPKRMREIFKEVETIYEPRTSDHNSIRVLCKGFLTN